MEPGVTRLLEFCQPIAAGLAHLLDRLEDVARIGVVAELTVDAELDRKAGETLEFLVGPEHQYVHASHHAGDSLVGDLREYLLAELKKDEVCAVAE